MSFSIIVAMLAFSLVTGCKARNAGQSGKPLMVNAPAPAFDLVDTSGRAWRLSELKGKVVFLNFWATWCPSCVQEMPSIHNLNVLASGADNFLILTVLYQDSPEKALEYFKNEGFGMPILLDKDSRAAAMYGLTGVPETYIIDKKGILRDKKIGPWKFDTPETVQFLNRLLEEQS